MNIAFYSGASGIRAYQTQIDIIGNNVANVNTYGFKSDNTTFNDLVYKAMDINKNNTTEEGDDILVGSGVKLASQDLRFSQGTITNTGYALDFAIEGDGLFAVFRDNQVEYTRDGSFDISVENGQNYLVTSDGAYVLGKYGEKLTVDYNQTTGSIDNTAVADKIGVFSFSNPYGLYKLDTNSFLPTDTSGESQLATDGSYSIITSAIERSNTSLSQEMSDLIVAQKAYQFSARVVTTADELEEVVNNLR